METTGAATIEERIAACSIRDRRRLTRASAQPSQRASFSAALAKAEAVVATRRGAVPAIIYPDSLPITQRRQELLDAIRDHQVVIVAGETGSGKSTQLPKLCLELGRGVIGTIGHTQPRRVAARTIAQRVADETGTQLGDTVGYSVRFNDRVSDRTLVKVMTDGILLAEIQRDRELLAYDTLIIDEAHERSLNIDFLLGYLTQLLPRRPDLKLIVTSATIDTERFAEHFAAAVGTVPVITVEGRTFPVEVRYRPYGPDNVIGHELGHELGNGQPAETQDHGTAEHRPSPAASRRRMNVDDRDQVQAAVDAVGELCREGSGDVLVFLSGEREIHDTADALKAAVQAGELRPLEVLPLYARLSAAEQQRIFQPHTGRRVVLATNVAETSLTVPGVRYVVDTGTARISRYNSRLKVQRLPIEPVSQASADQRAGRCGRVAPGICIRLYTEDDYADRDEFTEPEILRTNLASVILQMTALGLGDVDAFPFVEPPDRRAVKDGVLLLEELGALELDEDDDEARRPLSGGARRLTRIGRDLARLPVDPRLGRMVLEAHRLGCVREVLVIAAALSIQDPRERPQEQRGTADESHARFNESGSDFLALVALWDHLREQQKRLSGNQFRRLCRNEFLNYLRVREWQDLYSQLKQVAGQIGIHLSGATNGHPDKVHQALLTGLVSQIGMRDTETGRDYRGARNSRFVIASGSAVGKRQPPWVMVAELVETSRLFGRVAAAIQPEWAEKAAPQLVKYSYGEPRWDARAGRATVTEKAMLYGLPVIAGRTIGVDRVNPPVAREMFIRHALVEGDWPTRHTFIARNQRLMAELVELEERARRRDLVVGGEAIFAFYDRRLPLEITSGRHFDRWWKDERSKRPDLLTLTKEVLIADGIALPTEDDYPGTWRQGDLDLPVTYLFAPGDIADGATVHIPLAVLNRVEPTGFDWHVPGFREELVAELFRTLPKPIRRQLVPAAEYAAKAMWELHSTGGEPLLAQIARAAQHLSGHPVRPGDFEPARVPRHLQITFAVVGDKGRVLETDKDLVALKRRMSGAARSAVAAAAEAGGAGIEQRGLTAWTFGTVPPTIEVEREGNRVVAYPTLVDDGDSVSIRIVTNPELQTRAMRAGTRRLLLLSSTGARRVLASRATNALSLLCARFGFTSDRLIDDCLTAAVDAVLTEQVWDQATFEALREGVRFEVARTAGDLLVTAGEILQEAADVDDRLRRVTAESLQPSADDAAEHLLRLVKAGFPAVAGANRLTDVARYVKGISRRLDKLEDGRRDRQRMAEVQRFERRYIAALDAIGRHGGAASRRFNAETAELGWLLEEYRISVFAQMLGTRGSVSAQRLDRLLLALE